MSMTTHKWPCFPLDAIAEIERTAVSPENIKSGTRYVGLENMTSSGQFVGVGEVANGDLASTKFAFTNEHVLYGKLRPYLAKIARPDFSGVCSTDILPILPGPKVHRGFLLHFLRQPQMVDYASSRTSGANLPRLSPKALAEFEIPLPPLSEQKRIADILDKADSIRRKRQQALNEIETLSLSSYRHQFGHPIAASDSLPLGECVTMLSGGTPSKSNDAYWNGDFPWVSPKDMKVDYISSAEDHVTDLAFQETTLKKLPAEAILIVVRGMILAHTIPVALTDVPVAINQDMKALIANDGYDPHFLCWSLKAAHNYILGKVATAAHGTKRLEVEHLASFPIPQVTLSEQRHFARIVKKIRASRDRLATGVPEDLFNSLVQRAFNGEL